MMFMLFDCLGGFPTLTYLVVVKKDQKRLKLIYTFFFVETKLKKRMDNEQNQGIES